MKSGKGFMTRAEVVTLLGMLLVVASLFLTWTRVTPQDAALLAATALYRSPEATLERNGFQSHLWQAMTLCAVVSSMTLLWEQRPATRLSLAAVQGAGALACLVIALTHFALLPGALMALCGGALLTYGAIDRYGVATPVRF
jgi:hypothetical protein